MKSTCSLVLLSDCFFRYFFQIRFPRFGVFDCLERKKKTRPVFEIEIELSIINRDFCRDFPNIETERYFVLFSIFNRDRRSGSPSLIHSLPVHLKSGDLTHIQRVRHTDSHIQCTCTYIGEQLLLLLYAYITWHPPPDNSTYVFEFQIHLINRALLLNPLVLILTGTRWHQVYYRCIARGM